MCPPGQEGVDPVGNNTWYYVHTMAVFYIDEVLIHGSEGDQCNDPPVRHSFRRPIRVADSSAASRGGS